MNPPAPTFLAAVADFLAQKRIAVVGVSRRSGHVSRAIFTKLKAPGREVVPVNPGVDEIAGERCYPDLRAVPDGVGAVMVVTKPAATTQVLRECAALGIKHVWVHRSLGPGSHSTEAEQIAREAGITLIPAGCPMMYCAPVDPAHRCLRWCLRLFGRLPATLPS
jgi:predicted CoA-binding protein